MKLCIVRLHRVYYLFGDELDTRLTVALISHTNSTEFNFSLKCKSCMKNPHTFCWNWIDLANKRKILLAQEPLWINNSLLCQSTPAIAARLMLCCSTIAHDITPGQWQGNAIQQFIPVSMFRLKIFWKNKQRIPKIVGKWIRFSIFRIVYCIRMQPP